MTHSFPILAVLVLTGAAALKGWTTGQTPARVGLQDLDLQGVKAEPVRHKGREGIRLIESDKSRKSGLAILKGTAFTDGEITVDVAGQRGPYAQPDDRGFIGVAFRISPGAERLAYFYIRPENGRAEDQVRRNHSTQYASHPDFPWPRMRKEFPERYESYVDLEPGQWTSLRIVVAGSNARLFVHGSSQPALVVSDLKHNETSGGVGVWIGAGTEGFFTNLRASPSR